MPQFDVVFVGRMILPEVSTGPIIPPSVPPGYWGGVAPPLPTHPIAPGGPPPGYWGGYRPPYVDIGGPGPQPVPPGYWGGGNVPMPSPPIYLPPSPGSPPGSPPIAAQLPVFPWTPQHPIELPPDDTHPEHPIVLPPTTPDGRPIDWKTAWTPMSGWIVVGIPTVPVPTPSGP
jgi:hypothetical protein